MYSSANSVYLSIVLIHVVSTHTIQLHTLSILSIHNIDTVADSNVSLTAGGSTVRISVYYILFEYDYDNTLIPNFFTSKHTYRQNLMLQSNTCIRADK